MKLLTVVASLLGVAFVCALIWAILATNDLNSTRNVLSVTQAQLASTTAELGQTKAQLVDTKNELADTKSELANTRNDLADARNELADTKSELLNTRSELTSAQGELSSTKSKLSSTESELSDVRQQLDVARETLDGLGITLLSSKECYDVKLVDNPQATNPTWNELKAFISNDKTDRHEYIKNVYDCSQFSRDVHNNAEAAGIRAAEVQIDFKNDSVGHALNAFMTTDYGLVYIDCTGSPDISARIEKGKTYRGIELNYITAASVRNDSWWDSINTYYYMPTSKGGQAVVADIAIFW